MLHAHTPHLSLRVRALLGGAALLLLPGCPADPVPVEDGDSTTTADGTTTCVSGTCGETTPPPGDTTLDDPCASSSCTASTTTSEPTSTDDTAGTSSGGSSSGGATEGMSTTTGGESSSGGTTEGLSAGSTTTGGEFETGVVFIIEPDGGGGAFECDPYLQDCPAGEKCMPWANDGGGSWNALGCFPIDAMPVGVGQVCTVQGSGTSGIDNCELGAMCWDVDGATNEGTCVAMCTGSPMAPVCGAGTSCVITNDGVLNLCLPACDPLLQDCAAGEGCYLVGDEFFCAPDASGANGVDGDPCEFINVCDPGLLCSGAAAVEGCFGFSGCCTPFCDLSLPGDPCPAVTEECVAIYDPGLAPPGLEDVGACVIP